jgi:hypothetical protein
MLAMGATVDRGGRAVLSGLDESSPLAGPMNRTPTFYARDDGRKYGITCFPNSLIESMMFW